MSVSEELLVSFKIFTTGDRHVFQAGLVSLCPRRWTLTIEYPSSTNWVLEWKPCDSTLRNQLKALCQSGKGSTNGSTSSAFSFFYVHVLTLYVCRVRRAPMQRQRTTHGHAFPSTIWVLWMELSLPGLAAGTSTHWAISLCTLPPSPFLLVASPRSGRLVVIFLHLDPQENVGLRTDHLVSLSSTEPRDYRAGALFKFAQKIASQCYLLSPQLCLSALPMCWTECSM